MSPEDAELLQRFAVRRDEGAFGAIVRRYLGLVYHAALRQVGDAHAAEDIAQSVFTILARKAGQLNHHEALAGWLHTAARWEARRHLRAVRRRQANELEASMSESIEATTAVENWERLRPVIDAALGELGTTDRDAILLRFFADQPFSAVGAQLGLSENTARMRVERALQRLHGRLRLRGITSVSLAAALAAEAVAESAPSALAAQVTAGAIAGAGAASTTATLLFMANAKIVVSAAVLLVAALGSAGYEYHEAKLARNERATMERDLTSARAQAAALEARRSAEGKGAGPAAAGSAEQGSESAKAAGKPATASAEAKGPAVNPVEAARQYRLQLEQFKASLALKYAGLYRALNLSGEQIAAFEKAQVECRENISEIWSTAAAAGLPTDGDTSASTAVARMTSDPLKGLEDKLKTVIGEGGLAQLKAYDSLPNDGARSLISAFAGDLYASETPLTPAQGAQLFKLMAENSTQEKALMASDGSKEPMSMLYRQTDWPAVSAGAAGFLSPAQMAVLRSRIAVQSAEDEIQKPAGAKTQP